MSRARYSRWSELPEDSPRARLRRRRVAGERAMVSEVVLEKGCHVPAHAHANEQITMVLSGRLRLRVGAAGAPVEEEYVLGPGDVLVLPSMVPHAALALEDTRVLDVFSPVSEGTGIDQAGAGRP